MVFSTLYYILQLKMFENSLHQLLLTCNLHFTICQHINIPVITAERVKNSYVYMCVCVCVCVCVYIYIHRVSQEERTKLREGVPYVKLY